MVKPARAAATATPWEPYRPLKSTATDASVATTVQSGLIIRAPAAYVVMKFYARNRAPRRVKVHNYFVGVYWNEFIFWQSSYMSN